VTKARRKRLNGEDRTKRIVALAERDGWQCWYCGTGLTLGSKATTIDEWIPLGRGGGPDLGNQVLCCSPCNQDKADMTGGEYLHKLEHGGPPRSYFDWRVELKRQQRIGWPAGRAVFTPMERARRRPSRLTTTLAEVWPA